MRERLRIRRATRRREEAAIRRAVDHFEASRGVRAMGGHVLRLDDHEAIVRVMYLTDHVPPDRAWFTVSADGDAVRELSFDDVRALESPWR